jgi:hypothetical protein
MKKKELIELLSIYDDECDIVITDCGGWNTGISINLVCDNIEIRHFEETIK